MRISDWSSDVCSSDLIEDLMLSCRIQGKFIENALLHHLCTRPEWCASFVEIVFKPTDRNAAAQSALSRLGFTPVEPDLLRIDARSEEHTSELQSLMRISYAVFCLKKQKKYNNHKIT